MPPIDSKEIWEIKAMQVRYVMGIGHTGSCPLEDLVGLKHGDNDILSLYT